MRPITPKAPSLAASCFDQGQGRRQGPRIARGGCSGRLAGGAGGWPAARRRAAGRLPSAARRRCAGWCEAWESREYRLSRCGPRRPRSTVTWSPVAQLRQIGRAPARRSEPGLGTAPRPPPRRRARIRSGSPSRIAAGATPHAPPRPAPTRTTTSHAPRRMTTTRPATDAPRCGCRGSITTPGGGIQTTPQRERLVEHDRVGARCSGCEHATDQRGRHHGVAPQRWIPPDAPVDRGTHALAQRAEDDLRTDVGRRVEGPLGRVGHGRQRARTQHRRDVAAGVDQQLRAGIAQALRRAPPPRRRPGCRGRSRRAARRRQRRARRPASSRSRLQLRQRGVRRAERDGADRASGLGSLRRWSSASRAARSSANPITSTSSGSRPCERGLERRRLGRRANRVKHRHRAGGGGRGADGLEPILG